jgi:hypothetical protein
MKIIPEVLDAIDEYHERSLLMQRYYFEKENIENIEEKINDDLIFNVPIYDMLDRRYASFSSFLEALDKKEDDPKGNGTRFKDHKINKEFDFFVLYYLFRLCGSGIDYKPGSHGFGNFWIVKMIEDGYYKSEDWLASIPDSKFCNNKGYLLPQFSIGLKKYIEDYSIDLVKYLFFEFTHRRHDIIELVDKGNAWLTNSGFKRQNFVLSAFAADVAEYFPAYVNPSSMIYAGTNAKKCIKAIFGRCDESEAIDFLAKRYNSIPYSVEDSRLCDPVRYFLDYQSKYHIEKNNGKVFYNNSILKKTWTQDQYKNFQLQLQK